MGLSGSLDRTRRPLPGGATAASEGAFAAVAAGWPGVWGTPETADFGRPTSPALAGADGRAGATGLAAG
eukprot:1413609-Alexandrium_andersonii.AAC.1